MRTTAAVARRSGAFEITTIELDEPRPDEVLVELVAVGICHTDLSAARGVIPFPLPAVLGHEGAGRVRAVGSAVTRVKVGDPVVLTFTSCGRCPACRGGQPAYCRHHLEWNLLGGARADGTATMRENRDGRDGALHGHFFGQSSFARHALVDERSLIPLAPDASDDDLATYAPLGCGMQTGAGAVLNVLKPGTDATLVIAGAGAVGLAAVMASAAIAVPRIIVVDLVDARLELARDLGATHTVNPSREDLREVLDRVTDGAGATGAVETTGNVGVLEELIGALAVCGTCLVIGAPAAGARASFDVNAHLPGRRIVGVTLGAAEPESFVPQLIGLHRAGRFPLERLQRRYGLRDIATAVEDAESGRTIKPVLLMADDPEARA